MPVSESANLHPIIAEIERINPVGIMDLGVGFGLIGVAARNYLDARWGRCKPEEWAHTICGVEGWEAYENPAWGVYDTIYIADFSEYFKEVMGWDLVLAIDSLEHLEKDKAIEIIDYLLEHNRNLVISVPLGNCEQGAVFGNEFERHRASWFVQDFDRWPNKKVLWQAVCYVVALRGKQE